jgi:secondary thiamine-phosphate synthase enzyme
MTNLPARNIRGHANVIVRAGANKRDGMRASSCSLNRRGRRVILPVTRSVEFTPVHQATHVLNIRTARRGLVEITREIRAWLGSQKVTTGLLTVFCKHTSASLLIQENAAREVRSDLEAFFEQLAPEEEGRYAHDDEGPDDMPAHLRAALTQVQLSIPVMDGEMVLGTWQGIYLFEHRERPHERQLVLHLMAE